MAIQESYVPSSVCAVRSPFHPDRDPVQLYSIHASRPDVKTFSINKGFQNHVGFAIIQANGEEWQVRSQ